MNDICFVQGEAGNKHIPQLAMVSRMLTEGTRRVLHMKAPRHLPLTFVYQEDTTAMDIMR